MTAEVTATHRAVRLLVMARKLCDRSYSARELAMSLGVGKRTILRDIRMLRGEPLYIPLTRRGYTWRIPRSWHF